MLRSGSNLEISLLLSCPWQSSELPVSPGSLPGPNSIHVTLQGPFPPYIPNIYTLKPKWAFITFYSQASLQIALLQTRSRCSRCPRCPVERAVLSPCGSEGGTCPALDWTGCLPTAFVPRVSLSSPFPFSLCLFLLLSQHRPQLASVGHVYYASGNEYFIK